MTGPLPPQSVNSPVEFRIDTGHLPSLNQENVLKQLFEHTNSYLNRVEIALTGSTTPMQEEMGGRKTVPTSSTGSWVAPADWTTSATASAEVFLSGTKPGDLSAADDFSDMLKEWRSYDSYLHSVLKQHMLTSEEVQDVVTELANKRMEEIEDARNEVMLGNVALKKLDVEYEKAIHVRAQLEERGESLGNASDKVYAVFLQVVSKVDNINELGVDPAVNRFTMDVEHASDKIHQKTRALGLPNTNPLVSDPQSDEDRGVTKDRLAQLRLLSPDFANEDALYLASHSEAFQKALGDLGEGEFGLVKSKYQQLAKGNYDKSRKDSDPLQNRDSRTRSNVVNLVSLVDEYYSPNDADRSKLRGVIGPQIRQAQGPLASFSAGSFYLGSGDEPPNGPRPSPPQ